MAITRTALTDKAKTLVQAQFAKGNGSDKFILPNEELGIITEMLNQTNPLAVYTGVSIAAAGYGSVEVKYDVYNDNWAVKSVKGSKAAGGDDVQITSEIFKWNLPNVKEEAMSAFDLAKGTPNVLAQRMTEASIKFLQNSIKNGFTELVKAALAGTKSKASVAALGTTVTHDALTAHKLAIIQEVTKFIVANEIDPSEVVITLAPLEFDALAEQGLIGDRATQTFAGGQYSVGTIGGYKVQSGSMFLPANDGASTGAKNVIAFVGTSKVALHSVDFVAANAGKLGLSNDQGTYLEMADIFGVMGYEAQFGKPQMLVITEA